MHCCCMVVFQLLMYLPAGAFDSKANVDDFTRLLK